MSEVAKTTVFVAIAIAALAVLMLVSYTNRPAEMATDADDLIGQPLFADFDPLDITSLEIIKYDESTGQPNRFMVAQVDGIWSIPSHDDYPADAKDQLAEAAGSVIGRTVNGVASINPGDHALYGVIDPGAKDLKPGSVGVGSRVVMKGVQNDKNDQTLLALIIGKKADEEKELYYVRRVGQDPTYTMKLDPEKLSTKFDDWIEKDLLKLNTWDIKQVMTRDHSVDEANMALVQRGEMVLEYNDTGEPQWKMLVDQEFDDGKWVPVKMTDSEELNSTKLNEMKTALDELKIVDVRRKPAGLSGNLQAEKGFLNDNEARMSLMSKGFFPARVSGREEQIFSNEGDIYVMMKDGVQYVLRFGNIAGDTNDGNKKKEGEDSDEGQLNRYIFVMAEFNADAIEKPELEPLPEAKPEANADESDEAAKKEDNAKKDDEKQDESADTVEEAAKDEAGEKKTDEKSDEELAKERERIEKENQRKQDEYDEKVAEGKKKVKELNGRFANWYYIISDDVYKKIHLSRKDVVKEKEPAEGEKSSDAMPGLPSLQPPASTNPVDTFNQLKQPLPSE